MCLEFPQFGYDVLSKLILSSQLSIPNTNVRNSACLGREAQARKAREVTPNSRQLPQASSCAVALYLLRVCNSYRTSRSFELLSSTKSLIMPVCTTIKATLFFAAELCGGGEDRGGLSRFKE